MAKAGLQTKNTYQKHHASQMEKILSALPKKASALERQFVEQFYIKVPAPDLERFEPSHAVTLALSSFAFMQSRKAGQPKIRVFYPKMAEDGYES